MIFLLNQIKCKTVGTSNEFVLIKIEIIILYMSIFKYCYCVSI